MISPYALFYYGLMVVPFILFTVVFIVIVKRDNRIHCYIVNRNHEVRVKKVNPNLEYFRDRSSIYMIPSDCVTLSSTVKGLNPKSELFFVEDNPLPINFKPQKITVDGVEKDMDANVWITNKITVEMVLANTSKRKSEAFNLIVGYLSDPKKMLLLLFVGVIASALIFPDKVKDVVELMPR